MFTGLVEATGKVVRQTTARGNRVLSISAGFVPELKKGESVAVNGCCLTVTEVTKASFTVEAVATTLRATNLGEVRAGEIVNLERALAAGARMGGHYVQGHVDEVGTVRDVERRAGQVVLQVGVKRESGSLLIDKGSVCVDGVSLTVADTTPGRFTVNVIPHTWESTTFSRLQPGSKVNIEYDVIVKSVQHYLRSQPGRH